MTSSGLAVFPAQVALSGNVIGREVKARSTSTILRVSYAEEADPSGRDPFDIRILDPQLARRLRYL